MNPPVSYPSLPLLWMASSSEMPSSDLKASQSIFDFSSVLIFGFFPPIRLMRLDMPATRLALLTEQGEPLKGDTVMSPKHFFAKNLQNYGVNVYR